MHIALLTILVRDYDEAIAFYTHVLGFELVEDTDVGGGKRWVRLAPPARADAPAHVATLLLARATTPAQLAAVGNQTGGRVMGFFHTDDLTVITTPCSRAACGSCVRRSMRRMALSQCSRICTATCLT